MPPCFYECLDANKQRLDPRKFYLYRCAQREDLNKHDWLKIIAACDDISRLEHALVHSGKLGTKKNVGVKQKFECKCPEPRIFRNLVDDEIKTYGPEHTEWYRLYVEDPNLDNVKFRSKFRRRF